MNHEKIAGTFFEENLRFEKIFYLPTSAPDTDNPSVDLRSEIESDEYMIEAWGVDLSGCDDDPNEVPCEEILHYALMQGKYGYLINAQTPYPSNISTYETGKVTGYSFSWGHTTGQWFYGDSLEEIADKAVKWKEALLLKMVTENFK